MRIINLTAVFLFLTLTHCNAQPNQIDVFSGELRINSQLVFGEATPQHVQSLFGQPSSTKTEFWEMSEETATVFVYNNGGIFKFTNDKLKSFKLTSDNYFVQMDNFELRIGANINSIQHQFSKSYSYRNSGRTSIALGSGDYQFLLIEYNAQKVIENIELRTF